MYFTPSSQALRLAVSRKRENAVIDRSAMWALDSRTTQTPALLEASLKCQLCRLATSSLFHETTVRGDRRASVCMESDF